MTRCAFREIPPELQVLVQEFLEFPDTLALLYCTRGLPRELPKAKSADQQTLILPNSRRGIFPLLRKHGYEVHTLKEICKFYYGRNLPSVSTDSVWMTPREIIKEMPLRPGRREIVNFSAPTIDGCTVLSQLLVKSDYPLLRFTLAISAKQYKIVYPRLCEDPCAFEIPMLGIPLENQDIRCHFDTKQSTPVGANITIRYLVTMQPILAVRETKAYEFQIPLIRANDELSLLAWIPSDGTWVYSLLICTRHINGVYLLLDRHYPLPLEIESHRGADTFWRINFGAYPLHIRNRSSDYLILCYSREPGTHRYVTKCFLEWNYIASS